MRKKRIAKRLIGQSGSVSNLEQNVFRWSIRHFHRQDYLAGEYECCIAMAMIDCPRTGQELSTGIPLDLRPDCPRVRNFVQTAMGAGR